MRTFLVLASSAVALTLSSLGSTLTAQGRNLAGLATASARYPLMFGVDRPGRLLAEMAQGIDGYRDDPLQVAVLADMDKDFRSDLQLSVFDLTTFAATGIGVDRPMRVALFDFGGWLGFPRTVFLELGVGDRAKFEPWFLCRFPDPEMVEGSKPVVWYSDNGHSAWTIIGKTCTAIFSGGDQSPEEELETALNAKGRSMTIGSLPGFKRGAEYLGQDPSAHVALYVHGEDPISGRKLLDKTPIEGLLFALGRRGAFLSIIPKEESALLAGIRSGSDCSEFLARMPKPLASASLSVADPIGLIRDSMEEFFPSELRDLDEGAGMMNDAFGLSEAELQQQLKNGSVAMLLYPGRRAHEPRFLVVLHLNDAKSIRTKIKGLIEGGKLPAEIEIDDVTCLLAKQEGDEASLAIVGDYLVAGTAKAELLALAKSGPEGAAWTPQVGHGEIFELDIGVADMFALAGERLSERLLAELKAAGQFHGVAKLAKDGFVVELGFRSKTGRGQLGELMHLLLVAMAEDHGARSLKRQTNVCEANLSALSGAATRAWKTTGKLPRLPVEDLQQRDPWGTKFRLRLDKTKGLVVAHCAGTDGRFGTDDDLASK